MIGELVREICEAFGRSIEEEVLRRLTLYFSNLFLWNRRINLTGIRDEGEAIKKHLCDSLAVLDLIKPKKVLDIGTGAGIPGLIIKILNPELDVYLVEASRKKVSFLSYVTALLGFGDVKIINERLSDEVPSKLLLSYSPFDTILSQAVGDALYLYRLSRFYVNRDTHLVLMKGRDVEGELGLIKENVEGRIDLKWTYVPVLGVNRCFIVISEMGGDESEGKTLKGYM